ncbi:MAG TPA: bifunctional glutamate N-acetyltransferase/amino-acid acetyltransferase ArgJ [Nitrospiria bacterium]|jgi:glutamate N-acetyltransferase/amino-acid N-acetyltransferase|nr:bifunctional glutamate N-acetyltransferase/amino-acid acetyltransferase ArgJ [Nitrospiria bacterium]
MKKIQGGITAVQGFRAAGLHCGIKSGRSPDLALIAADHRCSSAAVFTLNRAAAAPVVLTRNHSRNGNLQAIVANSGSANACTGAEGLAIAEQMATITGKMLGISPRRIAVASTGKIGAPPSLKALQSGIPRAISSLSHKGSRKAAEAILTTDTFTKEAAVRVRILGKTVTIGGIAKGAGMIHPNMATMLAFLTTDARIPSARLQKMLTAAVDRSFNMVSVDGETSTNDMVVCLANGAAENESIERSPAARRAFQESLDAVCTELAKMIARDGEGATKLAEIRVVGAKNEDAARSIARRISQSPLVKTAFLGEDANWGRIAAAAGSAGVEFDPARVSIFFDNVAVVQNGVGLGPAAERKAARVLGNKYFTVTLDLRTGRHTATAWTCDLTEEYIRINTAYRS